MGHMDLHSGRSQVNLDQLAVWMRELGAGDALVARTAAANTANQVLGLAYEHGVPLPARVAELAALQAADMVGGETAVEVVIFDRSGGLAGRSKFLQGRR
jgi:cobalt-precorrin-5B (C1)-methyltransferase